MVLISLGFILYGWKFVIDNESYKAQNGDDHSVNKAQKGQNRIVKNTVSQGTVRRKEQKEIKNDREALAGDTGGTGNQGSGHILKCGSVIISGIRFSDNIACEPTGMLLGEAELSQKPQGHDLQKMQVTRGVG